MINNSKALVEVEEVLNRLSRYEYKKIPIKVIEYISKSKDTSYTWEYIENLPLNEQNLCSDAKNILSEIFMNYILDEEDKKVFQKQFVNIEQEKAELRQPEITNLSDVFNSRKGSNTRKVQDSSEIIKKNDSLFGKLKHSLIKCFNRIFKKT